MSVNETNGKVTLSTPSELKISKRLKYMLGFQFKGRFFPKQTYQGDRPLDFAVIKSCMSISQILMNHTITIMAAQAMYWLSFPLKTKALMIL